MRRTATAILLAAILPACSRDAPTTATAVPPETGITVATPTVPRLELLWVATGFDAPEGAALAPDGNYFISNVNGSGTEKDGNGYIVKLTPGGEYSGTPFATGLDAPKGMTVYDCALYVADIDRVVKLDATTGERLGETPLEGAKFLNDMTVWNGKPHVSDSGTGLIHEIDRGDAFTLPGAGPFESINGILEDADGNLLLNTMNDGELISMDEDGKAITLATGMKNADGIGLVPGGGYLVSAYSGKIFYAGPDGTVTTLLNEEATQIGQNDLSVFGDIVIVPNWGPGTVTAWRVVRD